jgi:hypothetical protein
VWEVAIFFPSALMFPNFAFAIHLKHVLPETPHLRIVQPYAPLDILAKAALYAQLGFTDWISAVKSVQALP